MATLRELHEAATPEPWAAETPGGHMISTDPSEPPVHNVAGVTELADLALICAVRNALPALLNLAEAAGHLCDDVRADYVANGLTADRIGQDGEHEDLWIAVCALRGVGLLPEGGALPRYGV